MIWNRFLNPASLRPSTCGCSDLVAKTGAVDADGIDRSKEGTATDFAVLVAAMLAAGALVVVVGNSATSSE